MVKPIVGQKLRASQLGRGRGASIAGGSPNVTTGDRRDDTSRIDFTDHPVGGVHDIVIAGGIGDYIPGVTKGSLGSRSAVAGVRASIGTPRRSINDRLARRGANHRNKYD